MRVVLALSLSLALVACGGNEPPAATAPAAASPSAASAAASPSAASAVTEPASLGKKPLEVFNGCADVVTVVFGEDPTSPTAPKRQIAQSASILDAPRNVDGTQTVYLLDASGAPLVKASVSRHMKRVEIGRSCRTLDAR